ncbi:hypothetical protein [Desulfuribacillus alkaliarsenatis]|uniref:Uncharacterized protein n=1 Tax=Desulfuribacillus alkaliarsenatis TaxID=766136 RepID=A0A1E5G2I8_9FIRM|nr:hypothetical protein [Desulfuribacillus alkaliarsenatis]OEF97228.1 hypothetical protein BHF68_14795 [Desulfuribacillus alkaliarsenatis]
MNNTLRTKIKKYSAFLLIAIIVASVAYLIVYKVSFLPNGYDIVEVQNDSITLKSFNVVGIEKNIKTVSFSEKDTWKIDAIDYEVNRQKEFLWILFVAVTMSIILFVYKLCNGMKLWKAIFESNIIISALPLYVIITSVNRIRDLIS